MFDFIKNLFNNLNSNGIPIPLIRDNKTAKGGVSITLVFVSSLYVQIGLIGKYSKLLEGIDMTSALTWFGLCMGLYMFNKKISLDKQGLTLESSKENDPNS